MIEQERHFWRNPENFGEKAQRVVAISRNFRYNGANSITYIKERLFP